jgi:nucleotide-binding universal stress UspA family protein
VSAEPEHARGVVLVCYDESADARAAIAAAAPFVAGHHVVVACFWQPFADVARAYAISLLEIVQDPNDINRREHARAEAAAAEGAAFAAGHGIDADARAPEVSGRVDDAILAYADEIDAQLIVLASRGRSSAGYALLGDVAHDIVQRAHRPVLVVPAPTLASEVLASSIGGS